MPNSINVSVIVPIFNVEKYLDECLLSIISQKMPKMQIILIDDGSTDNSGAICDKYSKIDKRITVIHQSNIGGGSLGILGYLLQKGSISFMLIAMIRLRLIRYLLCMTMRKKIK